MRACPVPNVTSDVVFLTSTRNIAGGFYPPETEVTFQCANGYTLKSGSLTLLCTTNGTWASSTPVCAEIIGNESYRDTILIASGCTVLACILLSLLFLLDFYFYRKRKRRRKIIRSQGMIKEGETRPTSFFLPKETKKLLPLLMSPFYKEPQLGGQEVELLKRTLDSDIHRALECGTDRKAKGKSGKRRKRKSCSGSKLDAITQTDSFLLRAAIENLAVTRTLPVGTWKKKRKKHQVEPMPDGANSFQPLSVWCQGTCPSPARTSEAGAVSHYGIMPQEASGTALPFEDELRHQLGTEVTYLPVQQGRPLPPPPDVSRPSYDQPRPLEVVRMERTPYRTTDPAFPI